MAQDNRRHSDEIRYIVFDDGSLIACDMCGEMPATICPQCDYCHCMKHDEECQKEQMRYT